MSETEKQFVSSMTEKQYHQEQHGRKVNAIK